MTNLHIVLSLDLMSSLVRLVVLVPLSSTWLPPDYSGIWHTEADECAVTCSMSAIELLRKLKTSSLHAIDHLNRCTPSERISDAKHCLCYRQVGKKNIYHKWLLSPGGSCATVYRAVEVSTQMLSKSTSIPSQVISFEVLLKCTVCIFCC